MASDSNTLEIIRGISQAASHAYDGSHVEGFSSDETARKVGLKREEGNPLIDPRVMDGFKIKFHGNKLIINYHSQLQLNDVYAKSLKNDVESMIEKVAKFLKKEYKAVTKKTLTLKPEGEADILVQNASRRWTWCTATKVYTIGNINAQEVSEPSDDKRMDKSFKDFLSAGGWKGKRPENDTRKKSE